MATAKTAPRGNPQIQARIEPVLVSRLDALAAAIGSVAPPGARAFERSDAIRAVLLAGLPILEEHYGIKPAKSAKPAQKGAAKPVRKPATK